MVELSLRYGLTFEFLQSLSGFAGVARLLCGVAPLLHERLYSCAGLCDRDLQFRNATIELGQFAAGGRAQLLPLILDIQSGDPVGDGHGYVGIRGSVADGNDTGASDLSDREVAFQF